MRTIQDREEIGGNRYIVTPLAHIEGYRIDIMMAEYFHTLGLSQNQFLTEADALQDEPASIRLDYSPFMLHWIRIIETQSGRVYCLNRLEAQAFGLLFGACSHDGGNDGLLKDIIDLALRIGSFSAAARNPDGQLHNLADAQCWVGRNIGDIKMVDRPEHRVGIASYACIAQPAIRNARADYCILTGFDHKRYKPDWRDLPAVYPLGRNLMPSDDCYFWLRYIDCSTGISYSLWGPEADAFIMFRHRHCWGKSIHCVFDLDILSEPVWADDPNGFQFKDCLEQGSFLVNFEIHAHQAGIDE